VKGLAKDVVLFGEWPVVEAEAGEKIESNLNEAVVDFFLSSSSSSSSALRSLKSLRMGL